MAQGKKLTNDQRSRVIAMLLAGNTVSYVSEQTGASLSSVNRIKFSDQMKQHETEKKENEPSLNQLVTDHLTTSLEAVIAIARSIARNPDWITTQNAADLGQLFGIMSDKSIRIFDAKLRADRLALEQRQIEAGDNDPNS